MAIFPSSAFFSPSCVPNCDSFVAGGSKVVFAQAHIAKGEEVTLNLAKFDKSFCSRWGICEKTCAKRIQFRRITEINSNVFFHVR